MAPRSSRLISVELFKQAVVPMSNFFADTAYDYFDVVQIRVSTEEASVDAMFVRNPRLAIESEGDSLPKGVQLYDCIHNVCF